MVWTWTCNDYHDDSCIIRTQASSWAYRLHNSLSLCNIYLMFRSTPVRSILCRKSADLVVSRSFRPSSFATPRLRHASTSNTLTSPRVILGIRVLLGALSCALLGYTIGTSTSPPSPGVSLGLARRQASTEDDEPTYGTPKDFQKAVQELRDTFSNQGHESEIVSTDPDDLRVHGFSENDYHPGGCLSSLSVCHPTVFPSNRSPFTSGNHD